MNCLGWVVRLMGQNRAPMPPAMITQKFCFDFAMSLGFVISGAILVEYVFNYPGVGFMLLQAVQSQDYPLMQALFLLITVAVLLAIFISDIATALLDPRTRGGK